MNTLMINLIAILIVLILAISPVSFAEEKTEPDLSGCVCRIDERNGIVEVIPWVNKKYDYGRHKTIGFNSQTEFKLKEGSELTLTQGGKKYPVPYDDKEVKTRSELLGHHVEVTYNEKEGKFIATLINLKYHTLTYPPYITLGGGPAIGYKALTRCSCSTKE